MAFDPKNTQHKAQLHPVIIAVAQLLNVRYDDLLDMPFEQPWARSPDYKRNIRSGEFASIRAKAIYDWLRDHHFTIAHAYAPEIFPQTIEQRWQAIVDEAAISGQLVAQILTDSFGIVERETARSKADITIKHGQPFILTLTTDSPGHAILLQEANKRWVALPIDANDGLIIPISEGENRLPQGQEDTIGHFTEQNDHGPSQFVGVTSPNNAIPTDIAVLVDWVHGNSCTLHQTTVGFVG